MSEKYKELYEMIRADPLLRREAGEGWHPAGMNEAVLSAVVGREMAIEELREKRIANPEHPIAIEYREQVEHLQALKEEHGIGDPPPLPIE